MPEQVRKKKLFFNLLKKEKGQNLVGFALIVAFCAGIGLAAREAGLMEALNDTYSRQETAFAASDIKSGETKVSGDIGAVKIGGGGTNSSGGGSGSGSGGSAGGVTPQTDPPQTDPPQTDPPQTDPPQTDPPQTDPPQTDPPQTDPPQTDPPAGGGSNSTPGMPAGGQTGGNDIVSLASTPAGAMTILQKYVDYAKNHNLQQWQAVDPAWEAYQADGSPLGITSKDRFGALFIWNWQPADSNWTSWNDVSSSWQWSEIRNYYETWKNNNS